jgi:hypothetical protein
MRHKAVMNLDSSGKIIDSKYFTHFSDSCIVSNLSSFGVSLGNSSRDISVSASVLKNMEYDHLMVVPK